MERSVHDALCVVQRVLESKSLVVGGGAVETALSIYLENFATSMVRSGGGQGGGHTGGLRQLEVKLLRESGCVFVFWT